MKQATSDAPFPRSAAHLVLFALARTGRAGFRPAAPRLLVALLLLAAPFLTSPLFISPAKAEGPASVADLAGRLIDAVVNISTSQTVANQHNVPLPNLPEGKNPGDSFDDFLNKLNRDGNRRTVQSLGSGFVIDPSGIIVTNNHVIEDADEITAIFNDGARRKAKLLGRDSRDDIAVLKVEAGRPLPFVVMGDSTKMRVGDWVMAIGNPYGLGGSVTLGIVSARNRDINSGPDDNFIQTDAAINRGNSGGPLFNTNGEVIGINTAIISPSGGSIGIGFATPTETAANIIDQLRTYGEARRGWLGVNIQPVSDEIAGSLGLSDTNGALVGAVTPKSPAGQAGLKPGDVVISFDGHAVKEMRDLTRSVANTPVGKTVPVEIIREKKPMVLNVTIARLEASVAAPPESEDSTGPTVPSPPGSDISAMGMHLARVDPQLRKTYKLPSTAKGVVVVAVDAASQASEKSIVAGDQILQIGEKSVTAPEDVATELDMQRKDGRKIATVLIQSVDGQQRTLTLKLGN